MAHNEDIVDIFMGGKTLPVHSIATREEETDQSTIPMEKRSTYKGDKPMALFESIKKAKKNKFEITCLGIGGP